ncbi:MAG: LCP family protein [Eubacteriales bacterium]|nr:LCP family protein [Eubacteriales bacterium]
MSRRYDGDRHFAFSDDYGDSSGKSSFYEFEDTSYDYGGDQEDINIYSSSRRGHQDGNGYSNDYAEDRYRDEGSDDFDDGYGECYGRDGRRVKSACDSEREPNRKKKKSKFSFKRLIAAVLTVLLILLGSFAFVCYSVVGDVDYKEYEDLPFEASDDGEFNTLSSDDLYSRFYVKNIMLFGIDEDSSEYGRSDTMMLLSIDFLHRKLKLTSFQRDTFIYCPDPEGDYRTKLTNGFSYGGVPLAINTIEANFGVEIDSYATVNFETFKSIVDVLGGVTIELSEDEIGYINGQIYDNGQSSDNYIDAPAGPVNLNGTQALWYARNRGGTYGGVTYDGNDWDRTGRQRKFLEAVADSMKKANPVELLGIIKSVTPNVTTDLSRIELTAMAMMSPLYLTFDICEASMPTEDNWIYDENFAGDIIYVTNWQQVRDDLKTFVYE